MNLRGFVFDILGLLLPFSGSRCVGHLLPDARGCRVSWVMVAEMTRWGTHAVRMLPHGLRQLMCARRGMCFACLVGLCACRAFVCLLCTR